MDFVRSNVAALGLEASDSGLHGIERRVFEGDRRHAYLSAAAVPGIPVYNAQLQINVNRDGRIISVNNSFLPGLQRAVTFAEAASCNCPRRSARRCSSPACEQRTSAAGIARHATA